MKNLRVPPYASFLQSEKGAGFEWQEFSLSNWRMLLLAQARKDIPTPVIALCSVAPPVSKIFSAFSDCFPENMGCPGSRGKEAASSSMHGLPQTDPLMYFNGSLFPRSWMHAWIYISLTTEASGKSVCLHKVSLSLAACDKLWSRRIDGKEGTDASNSSGWQRGCRLRSHMRRRLRSNIWLKEAKVTEAWENDGWKKQDTK